jgi:hypothetical protein
MITITPTRAAEEVARERMSNRSDKEWIDEADQVVVNELTDEWLNSETNRDKIVSAFSSYLGGDTGYLEQARRQCDSWVADRLREKAAGQAVPQEYLEGDEE